MDDTISSNPPPETTQVRLSLSYLFVWMTIAGATCAVTAMRYESRPLSGVQVTWFVPHLLGSSTAWTAMILLVRRRYRRQPIDFQPGYWLLCVCGTACAVCGGYWLVETLLEAFVGRLYVLKLIRSLVLDWGVILAILLTGFLFPVRPMWRWVLALPCLVIVVDYFQQSFLLFTQVNAIQFARQIIVAGTMVAPIVLLAIAIADQATTQDRRDWLHWLGVACTGLLISSPLWIAICQALLV
ncbi:hypothetical protein [Blastopirellula marina]|uniref:Uncharacterized protein n=1 Tax=Blastopirellula marina TaxID=124 RepID=A0A2S8FLV7_9BACT|nr:hypothetical protein [Blastopirellula marina]PQO33000.1 hypothetical protein C5Y98_17850 [Blastopirellula marina]PTL43167.1 hypothetical protein C5Y97_17860 [Blastopirellula marina]